MSNIPGPYLNGKQATTVALAVDTISGSTLTPGTPVSYLGVFDFWDIRFGPDYAEIHSTEARMKNYVILTDDFDATISEIILADGTSNNMAAAFASNFISFTAQCTGSNGAGKLLTVVGTRGELSYGVREGKNVCSLGIKPCGIYPTWA